MTRPGEGERRKWGGHTRRTYRRGDNFCSQVHEISKISGTGLPSWGRTEFVGRHLGHFREPLWNGSLMLSEAQTWAVSLGKRNNNVRHGTLKPAAPTLDTHRRKVRCHDFDGVAVQEYNRRLRKSLKEHAGFGYKGRLELEDNILTTSCLSHGAYKGAERVYAEKEIQARLSTCPAMCTNTPTHVSFSGKLHPRSCTGGWLSVNMVT